MVKKAQRNNPHGNTSKEHLTSSTVGHTISGSPRPSGVLSSEKPEDIEDDSSVIHFSSKEPREENCNNPSYNWLEKVLSSEQKYTQPLFHKSCLVAQTTASVLIKYIQWLAKRGQTKLITPRTPQNIDHVHTMIS